MKVNPATDALIIVDVQRDFCKGGTLPVPDADAIVPIINSIRPLFGCIVVTQDWHPQQHISFASYHDNAKPFTEVGGRMLWPDHCVKGTEGAQIHPDLRVSPGDISIVKGFAEERDSFSPFTDEAGNDSMLAAELNYWRVKRLYVCGLATEYCVKATVLDALKIGFETVLLSDAVRGVAGAETVQEHVAEMVDAGAVCLSTQLLEAGE